MSARHYCDKCKKEISGVDIFSIHVDIDSPLFKKRMCDREYCQDCLMEFYKFIVPNASEADVENSLVSLQFYRDRYAEKQFKKMFGMG